MTEGAAVGDAKRVVRSRMREVRASIAADPADRARRSASICDRLIALDGPATAGRPSSFAYWSSSRSRANRTSRRSAHGAPPTGWRRTDRSSTATPCSSNPADVDPAVLDVVVVPGLAFTRRGDRLGQGGGHFDRFLTRLRGDCLRIGVAFHEQLVAALPIADTTSPSMS